MTTKKASFFLSPSYSESSCLCCYVGADSCEICRLNVNDEKYFETVEADVCHLNTISLKCDLAK